MHYFDNVFLGQYLDTGADISVYVDSEWYTLSDTSDVSDPVDGNGYNEWGGSHKFNYQAIEKIKVNGQIVDREMLATKMGETPPEGEKKPKPSNSGGEEELEDKPKEKEPDLSWFSPAYDIGRELLKERERKNWKLSSKN